MKVTKIVDTVKMKHFAMVKSSVADPFRDITDPDESYIYNNKLTTAIKSALRKGIVYYIYKNWLPVIYSFI